MGKKLSVDEVCERLHISRPHLNQMQFRGDAPPRIEISPRRFLYDEDSLEKWLMDRERATVSA